MAKTDFSWVNAVDTASTITAGSEAATLPSSNLASPRFGRIWRTSAATTSFFIITFAAVTSVQILALGSCTLASTDTVRHRLYDTDGVTVLYDSGVVACGVLPGYALHIKKLTQAYFAKSWRCDIVATSRATQGYFDIGRAWAGAVFQPTVGISRPWDDGWTDGAPVQRGKLSGGFFTADGPQYRQLNITLDFLSDAEKAQIKEMLRIVGVRSQALVVPDEDGDMPREAVLGHFQGPVQPARNSLNIVPPVYSQSLSIIQDL